MGCSGSSQDKAHSGKGVDRMEELNDRLDLWEQGKFDYLIGKIVGQQVQDVVKI